MDEAVGMFVYSALLALAAWLSAPLWLFAMAFRGKYKQGLRQRLGRVPASITDAAKGKQVIWIHAVSVGEVLAIVRLVAELQTALGQGWVIAVSTTTATGQAMARERLAPLGCPVFYFPLDFRFAVKPWLQALNPRLLILVESELWPRVLYECKRRRIPVAVINARMSDRSYKRTNWVQPAWLWMALKVSVYLAQGRETASRLQKLGIPASRVQVTGNLKYDVRNEGRNDVAEWIQSVAAGRKIVLAGSTVDRRNDSSLSEEEIVIQAWEGSLRTSRVLLVLAPRQPGRFGEVTATAIEFRTLLASTRRPFDQSTLPGLLPEIIVLDTLGDLASVYEVADVAFIGGSLVPRGGHNPLEAARFGVPVVMGPSYQNFREMVDGMQAADAIRITSNENLEQALSSLLHDDGGMGQRGKQFFEQQAGTLDRTLRALLELLHA